MIQHRPMRWLLFSLVLLSFGAILLSACGNDGPESLTVERPVRVVRDDQRDCIVLANNTLAPCENNDIHVLYGYFGATGTETVAAMTDVVLDDADVPDHDLSAIQLQNSEMPTYTLGIGLATYDSLERSAICVFIDTDNSPRTGYRDAAVSGIENLICEGNLGYQLFWYDAGGSPILQSESPAYAHFVTTDNGLILIFEGTDGVILNGTVQIYVAVIDAEGLLQDSAGPLELNFPGGG